MSLQRLGVLAVYLSQQRLEEISFYRKLSIYGKKLGLEINVFTPEDVDGGSSTIRALVYNQDLDKWERKRTSFPPLIYDRVRKNSPESFRRLRAFKNKFKILRFMGTPLANKLIMHQVLSANDNIKPHLPATVKYTGPTDLLRFLKKYSAVYLKPRNGTGGRGILRVERIGSEQYLIQGRNTQRNIIAPQSSDQLRLFSKLDALQLSDQYVMQQGIAITLQDGRVHDYRLLIQKNGSGKWEVTGCAGRIGPRRSITSNLHGGGSAISMEKLLQQRFSSKDKIEKIKDTMFQLGHNIASFIEKKYGKMCELGIDLAVDRDGRVWLIEVNPKPSREVFQRIGETQTYRKAITRPLEYALWMLGQQKPKSADE